MDYIINNLPLELHLPSLKRESVKDGQFNDRPSYSYCGPGTRFSERISQGYTGINHLDRLCKMHDEAYAKFSGRSGRLEADQALVSGAIDIVGNSEHDITERLYAFMVASYFGYTSSKFSVGSRRVDGFLNQHPSVSHFLSHLPANDSISSSKLLSSLLSHPTLKKEILRESRDYNISFEKYRSILFNKFRTSLLSSSLPTLSSSQSRFIPSSKFSIRKPSFFSRAKTRFRKLFMKKRRFVRYY
jgi:hypothetical protein